MRHLVILNPAAGKHDSTAALAAEAERAFSKAGLDYTVELTQYPGHAGEIAKKAAQSGEEVTVYACGGDGTISEAAQALYNAPHMTLAPVPVGTGNDFARTVSDEKGNNIYSLTELVTSGQTVSADMLIAGGRVAINIVSAGLDASIAKDVARYKRIPFVNGAMAYNLSTAINFFTKVKYKMSFEIDGKMTEPGDYVFAIAANGRYYGGGFKAAPLADIQDGLIDFMCIPSLPRVKLLPMIEQYRKGTHLEKYEFIKLIRCKKVKIISDEPVALNCDGEIAEEINPTIEVIPGGMKLLIPSRFAQIAQK